MTAKPILCRYCGARIVMGPPRTATSAWQAPGELNPTACRIEAPGHAPEDPPVRTVMRPGY